MRGSQCGGAQPWPPRSLPLTARTGQSLPFTPRAVVLTLPLLALPGAFLSLVWGLHAGGFGETGAGQGQHLPGLESCPGFRMGLALESTPSPDFPMADSTLCNHPGSLVIRACTVVVQPPASAEPTSKVDSSTVRNTRGLPTHFRQKEQQTAKHPPDKAGGWNAAAGRPQSQGTPGSVGFVVARDGRLSVKFIIAEQNVFCSSRVECCLSKVHPLMS